MKDFSYTMHSSMRKTPIIIRGLKKNHRDKPLKKISPRQAIFKKSSPEQAILKKLSPQQAMRES